MEWSPSTRPWRMFQFWNLTPEYITIKITNKNKKSYLRASMCVFMLLLYLSVKCAVFANSCPSFAATLLACHPSTCAQVCLQWWVPCWLTSMPTMPTQHRQPTMYLPLTALLLLTLGWVTAEFLNSCFYLPLICYISKWQYLYILNSVVCFLCVFLPYVF